MTKLEFIQKKVNESLYFSRLSFDSYTLQSQILKEEIEI